LSEKKNRRFCGGFFAPQFVATIKLDGTTEVPDEAF